MRNRQHSRKRGGLAAKKYQALKRKGGPGPLTANDLYGRIAATPDRNVILKAQEFLKKYKFQPAKNRTELAHKLSSVVQMYGEDAIRDLAYFHPDRQLIAATVTETELKEVGNGDMFKPAEQPVQPKTEYHNACGACTMGMFNCEGNCNCNKNKNSTKNDTGNEKADAKGVKDGEHLVAMKEPDHTAPLIIGALALGLTIGVLETMATSSHVASRSEN